jgi:hypothetical protein
MRTGRGSFSAAPEASPIIATAGAPDLPAPRLEPGESVRPVILAIPLLGLCAACTPPQAGPGSVLLSNTQFGPTEVEAVLTTRSDCAARGPGFISSQVFTIPNEGTRFIEAPPGADVCWRRVVAGPKHSEEWSNWNLTYTYPGRSIDSDL